MSDATQNTPFPAEAPPPGNPPDPLAGDWSEGLRSAVRALGIPDPRLLEVESIVPPTPAPAFEAEKTPATPAPAFEAETTPATPAPAFEAEKTPSTPAPAFEAEKTPPTPSPAFEAPKAAEVSPPPPIALPPPPAVE